MSLTDQERIEMSADNCEVLRGRLAKYEDAEGNPISTIAEQAREIERLSKYKRFESQYYEAERELAALKAQPSGVVLPGRYADGQVNIDSTLFNEIRISEPVSEDGEPTKYIITEQQLQRIAGLEFARLNSSPVSAGEPVYQFQFREIGEGGWSSCDHDWYMHCQKNPERDTRVVQVGVSAGVVDERAAFEAAIEASSGMRPGNYSPDYDRYVSERLQGQYEGWKLARALTASAPNHGEQVREWVPVSERLPDEHKAEYLCLFDAGHQQVTEWLHDETEGWCFWYGDPTHWMPLPAAPSAGSQGGDV